MKFATRVLRVNGIALNVLDAGSGPAVLLLHGFPDDHQVWRLQVPALVAAGYRVVAPDQRGCGDSELLPAVADYRLPLLVADIAALLDALGVDKVQLIAHDWGAVIGWQFVMAHPGRVRQYIALSVGHPRAYARGGLAQNLKGYYVALFQLRGIAESLLRAGGWLALRVLTGLPREAPQWIARLERPGRLTAALNYYRANLHLLWRKDYAPVKVPVTGIYSDGDRFLTRGQMRGSEAYCEAGFRCLELAGVGHWMTLEAPAQVNEILLRTLEKQHATL